MDTNPSPLNISGTAGTSRRAFLRTAGLGAASAAVLAACSRNHDKAGQSGLEVPTTLTPPTVPTTVPSEATLKLEATQIRTAASLELLIASVYADHGPKFTDPALREAATRFESDHNAAAAVFADAVPKGEPTPEPNEFVKTSLVEPAEDGLIDDASRADFLSSLESALTATYISATGVMTDAAWRERFMTYGAATARRSALLGNGGTGSVVTEALYPLQDLVSAKAYVQSPEDIKAEEKAAAESN